MSETLERHEATTEDADGKIACCLCGARAHIIGVHLRSDHPDITVEEYQAQFPNAPILSPKALLVKRSAVQQRQPAAIAENADDFASETVAFNELFGLGNAAAAFSTSGGKPIPVHRLTSPVSLAHYVPRLDPDYVYNIDLLKTVLLGVEENINTYLFGHMGTGKSTIFEQFAARTGRPMIRVQHTRDTEQSHITGQTLVKDGATFFELGPLAYAMKHGLAYLADEYDFAMPAVSAIYQPVLEGKALIIKEADLANRVIEPHPNFRFWATGNTNGTGDDTGLYQGTMIQNAANYERFGIVEQVKYMEEKQEVMVIHAKARIGQAHATEIVRFANMCREGFERGDICLPPSPRSLINAAKTGARYANYQRGLELAYINRLDTASQAIVRETMSRMSF